MGLGHQSVGNKPQTQEELAAQLVEHAAKVLPRLRNAADKRVEFKIIIDEFSQSQIPSTTNVVGFLEKLWDHLGRLDGSQAGCAAAFNQYAVSQDIRIGEWMKNPGALRNLAAIYLQEKKSPSPE